MEVPVIVDEVNEDFTRASYFTIENNSVGDQWYLETENFGGIPFLMLRLYGILLGSNNFKNKNLFYSPEDFENIFLEIEKDERLSINTNSLIIPNNIIIKKYRGAFLRVPQELFKKLIDCNNNWEIDKINNLKNNSQEKIRVSPKEEEAFEKWCSKIISMDKMQ